MVKSVNKSSDFEGHIYLALWDETHDMVNSAKSHKGQDFHQNCTQIVASVVCKPEPFTSSKKNLLNINIITEFQMIRREVNK